MAGVSGARLSRLGVLLLVVMVSQVICPVGSAVGRDDVKSDKKPRRVMTVKKFLRKNKFSTRVKKIKYMQFSAAVSRSGVPTSMIKAITGKDRIADIMNGILAGVQIVPREGKPFGTLEVVYSEKKKFIVEIYPNQFMITFKTKKSSEPKRITFQSTKLERELEKVIRTKMVTPRRVQPE